MKSYQHIFFDLDHTLWDFERNSEETIAELYQFLKIDAVGIPSARNLYESFEKANRWAWNQYHLDLIDKESLRINRFQIALSDYGVHDNDLAENMAQHYLYNCPQKKHLLPGSIEILEYLVQKTKLHLISNGFAEITQQKIENTGLKGYFKSVTTPSHSGHKKPQKEMFMYALQKANCSAKDALMIGDDVEADVLGAQRCGIDQVFFNPSKQINVVESTYEIEELNQLRHFL